jgi:polysaccharide biosynthesis/export protein
MSSGILGDDGSKVAVKAQRKMMGCRYALPFSPPKQEVSMWKHGSLLFGSITSCFLGLLFVGQPAAQSAASTAGETAQSGASNSTVENPIVVTRHPSKPIDSGDYILGGGDRLSIRVFGADDLSNSPIDVSPEGDMMAPLVGRVRAGGMSVRDLEAALTQDYAKFYKSPEVTVTVVEYRSQPVTVVGSVNTPGVIQLRRPTRLMEVISQAGGLRPDAGDKVYITSMPPPGSSSGPNSDYKATTQEVDLQKIIEGRDPSLNILIQSNDLITIPKAKMVYVVGDIGRPGGYVLDGHSSTLSVLQAIALAGGVNKTAKASQTRILRPTGDDESHRTETRIDLQKILANKAPDVELRADDILFVPNSAAKNVGVRALQAAADIGTGLAIWRF